jgi:two-component system, chemotaxis family, sensor kinase Cph1
LKVLHDGMKVVDIVNRENQSLESCDQEPIHIPGAIQPHGFLITVDATAQHIIRYCSANCVEILNRKAIQILGRPVCDILSADDCARLEHYLSHELFDTSFACIVADAEYNVTAHRVNDVYTLEFEQFPEGSLTVTDQFNQTKRFVRNIQQAESLQEVCQSIADETRSITGYDRVMIYRFDKDYNGEVFAESKRDDIQSFLGHHYPHTDIPAQARELYLKNLLRIIVDVNYIPVPVLTLDDGSTETRQLDMSHAILRSISPMHIEYLKNMGVGATLTISLIENKKLWGLIACHHYAPKQVPFYTRLAAQLQGHFLTSQISVRESAAENELAGILDARLNQVLKSIAHADNFLMQPEILHTIADIPNATGVAVIRDGIIALSRSTPSAEQVRELLPWLISQSADGTYTTDTLSQHFTPALAYGRIGSGILYHNLGNADKDGIIWFRCEMDATINWAGNPTKEDSEDPCARLTPRKSFELWQEKVKNRSIDWKAPELNSAAKLAHLLQGQFYSMYLEEEEARYIQLTGRLKKANEELANINWIGTHDLKEPLRKIQIFASRILRSADQASPMVLDFVGRMQKSATRMQQLITDLLEYSKLNISNPNEAFKPVDLNEIVQNAAHQFETDMEETKASIKVLNLPTIKGIPFQLTQLFINLIDNSLKFAKKDNIPEIEIKATDVNIENIYYSKITVSDNGIGFSNLHNEKIFDVFQRLHSDAFQGTGIGLAICKKIMENHLGKIIAIGSANGATFELYFPLHEKHL